MWIKTDEDVSRFMDRVKAAWPDGYPLAASGALSIVEHELRHAIREKAPGIPSETLKGLC